MMADVSDEFFPYRFDWRFAPMWLVTGARPRRDGVHLTDDQFRATFGFLHLETPRTNITDAHVTEDYRWYTAIGARLSLADDGLTFGTNHDRGVCIHFEQPVRSPLRPRSHSALTVTVDDCDGLVAALSSD